MSRRKNANSPMPIGALLAGGIQGWRPRCYVDGCNHSDCARAAREEALRADHDHYVHDAYDRENDR